MRSGNWRRTPLAVAIGASLVLGLGLASSAHADGFLCPHVLPGVVPAYDFTTGGEYVAPTIPYGHYAKDYVGQAHKCLGYVTGPVHACLAKCAGMLHSCASCANGLCQGGACEGGDGHGGCVGDGCAAGHGLFDHAGGSACIVPGCGGGPGCLHQLHGQPAGMVIAGDGGGLAMAGGGIGTAVVGGAPLVPTGAGVVGGAMLPSTGVAVAPGQLGGHAGCGVPGCTIGFAHVHPSDGGVAGPGGGIPGFGVPPTPGVAGPGAGTGCSFCGGQGCQKCLAAAHGALATVAGLFHPHPKLKYFVGPGGPVPLTPGYVPYIVVTRSPRDFFAFPPRNPNDP